MRLVKGQGGRMQASGEATKQCCANLYASDWARLLLGDSFHPGGLALTERLGVLMGLGSASRVLDVAAGRGTSAIFLARRFGCRVVGVDYSARNVALAMDAAEAGGLADRVTFLQGDAERMQTCGALAFDGVLCECAFCTFPDRPAAAREMFRVLKPGGRLGLSDITLCAGRIPDGLNNLLSIAACIGDARPGAEYRRILSEANFVDFVEQDQSTYLVAMVDDIKKKIDLARLAVAINKLDLGGIDLNTARETALLARKTIEDGGAGYVLLTAAKPCGGA